MIRVIHYVWSLDFGGIENLTLDLARQQKKNPELTSAVLVGRQGGKLLNTLKESGISYLVASLSSGADLSPLKFIRLKKYFQQADIIHIHTFTALVCLAACLSGKRVVYTEHGNFAFGRKFTLADKVNAVLLKWFLNHCVHFVSFNSRFTQEEARRRYGLKKVKQEVIYNGIRLEKANDATTHTKPAGKLTGKFVVGTSSRFAGFKRIDRLIHAFSIFSEKKNDVVMLLVGEGPLKGDLEKLVAQNGLSGKTIFTGYSNNVSDHQAAMDISVFPSCNEPFGIAAIETLALGKPTLVMKDGGGLLEIISGIEPGDIADDEPALARRMEYYYQNRSELESGKERRMDYVRRFDIKDMEEKLFSVYKTC